VLAMLPDLQRRFLVATLWNSGARINEALALTPADFELDGGRPLWCCAPSSSAGAARAGLERGTVKRLVPLLDPAYAQLAREYLSTFKLAKSAPIWTVTDQTVRNWLKEAEGALRGRGITLVVALSPMCFGTATPCTTCSPATPISSACRRTWATVDPLNGSLYPGAGARCGGQRDRVEFFGGETGESAAAGRLMVA
ncbi:site-specific integrase, partial (plasmid) [Aeromonas sp. FDAARGOS 1405]